jgi:nucleotidyltransferase/DNA polymerase involved in DNA repair
MQIAQVPGLQAEQVSRLQAIGISNCRQLLRASRQRDRLLVLSSMTELSFEMLRSLVGRIELCQIRGIGPATLEQLWEVGVDSVETLANQDPLGLQMQLRKVAVRSPNLAVIEDWILQAQQHRGRQSAMSS